MPISLFSIRASYPQVNSKSPWDLDHSWMSTLVKMSMLVCRDLFHWLDGGSVMIQFILPKVPIMIPVQSLFGPRIWACLKAHLTQAPQVNNTNFTFIFEINALSSVLFFQPKKLKTQIFSSFLVLEDCKLQLTILLPLLDSSA